MVGQKVRLYHGKLVHPFDRFHNPQRNMFRIRHTNSLSSMPPVTIMGHSITHKKKQQKTMQKANKIAVEHSPRTWNAGNFARRSHPLWWPWSSFTATQDGRAIIASTLKSFHWQDYQRGRRCGPVPNLRPQASIIMTLIAKERQSQIPDRTGVTPLDQGFKGEIISFLFHSRLQAKG